MALNFPSAPSIGDVYSLGDRAWQYNGRGWIAYPGVVQGIADLYVTGDINSIEGDVNISGSFNVPGDLNVTAGDFNILAGDINLSGNFNATNDITIVGDLELLSDESAFTTILQTITPTADRVISFPNATGTIGLVAGSSGNLIANQGGAYAGVANSLVDNTTGNITLGSRFISSLNGALSATGITGVPVAVTGTWITTGGTATTTKPQVLIEPTGTTSTAWSTSGTGLGVNAASGFAGNLLDLQINGTSEWNFSGTVFNIGEANNIAVGTTTGTKIGTATTQKLGFFDKAPVVQPTAVANATDAATVITQLNALLTRMRDLGLIAT